MPELLFLSRIDDPEPWRATFARIAPDVRLRVWPDEVPDPAAVDCALVWNPPAGLLATFPRLKLIQSLGAGVDGLLSDPDLPRTVPIARVVDPMLTQCMIEYVLMHALWHHRLMPRFARQQAERRWEEAIAPPAQERTVGILGLGELGVAAGTALATVGFRVLGWSRSLREVAGVVCHAGRDGLPALLREAEILVCLLPLTRDTEAILDAGLFAQLPAGATLINCGRGRHLVEADLIAALDSGRLAGASLDVFRQEPLPADHPFWGRREILITPHVASISHPDSAARLVLDNIRRAFAGEAPRYQVDPARGY